MNNVFRFEVIEKYLSGITTDSYHRYTSWDHCYNAFEDDDNTDILPLHLGFYLASWGMYRGSAGLLQKNHLVHKGATEILQSKAFGGLKCHSTNEVSAKSISAIMELRDKLSEHYKKVKFDRGATIKGKHISDTDTLLSKVMLGTLACVPAYDRYFIAGLKEEGAKYTKFNNKSLQELFSYLDDNNQEVLKAQQHIKEKTRNHYPLMKIVDMYFWQIGFDADLKNKVINV